MTQAIFITGTDTDIGKTTFAVGLLNYLKSQGKKTLGFKPVSSGCERTAAGLRNSDALALQAAATVKLPYEAVNPYAFLEPIPPHVAATKVGKTIASADIIASYHTLLNYPADYLIMEGAGGWLLPLNAQETLADVVQTLQLPVILVVGIKLGCLNHALLSAENITRRGLQLLGWVANFVDPQCVHAAESCHTLETRLAAPLLGTIPFEKSRQHAEFIFPVADNAFHATQTA